MDTLCSPVSEMDPLAAVGFPALSTRHLAAPSIIHPQSCAPTMDVALLSSPCIATGQPSIQLVRLSGGNPSSSSGPAGPSLGGKDARAVRDGESSRAWEVSLENKAPAAVMPALPIASASSTVGAKTGHSTGSTRGGKAAANSANAVGPAIGSYIQPRAPETLAWSPDGHTFAFASTLQNFMLHSVHDGSPLLPSCPFMQASTSTSESSLLKGVPAPAAASEEEQLYLLSWERLLPAGESMKKPPIRAELLEIQLPKLGTVKKVQEKPATKTHTFVNPFAAGLNKPYSPSVPYTLRSFPTRPSVHAGTPAADAAATLSSMAEDELDLLPDHETQEALGMLKDPTLLALGDASGNLHLLLDGSLHLGSLHIGDGVDIVSCSVAKSLTHPKTPFNPKRHSTELRILASVPLEQLKTCHPALTLNSGFTPRVAPAERSETSTVFSFAIKLPNFPSSDLLMLARASTSMRTLLAHAVEALDEARKGWEEARELGKRWIDRLRDDSHAVLPELQLLQLLLTGKAGNTNMHDYFASKNTERNFDNWETKHFKAAARIRDTAYQNLTPVCERLTLWLAQMRGWGRWQERFGTFEIDLGEVERCIILLRLVMIRCNVMEEAALQEEIGFREFAGWTKFDLERVAAIESNTETRPTPRHDVLAVMSYIRQKLPSNPLDEMVLVETPQSTARYNAAMDDWLNAQLKASKVEHILNEGKAALPKLLKQLNKQFSDLRMDIGEVVAGLCGEDADDAIDEEVDDDWEFQLQMEKNFVDPPVAPVKPAPAAATRRKSAALAAEAKVNQAPINPVELPIPYYIAEVSRRLANLFDNSFATVTQAAEIGIASHVVTWKPPDREEDDAMAALGLARDPTKTTSRVVRSADPETGEPTSSLYIACEVPSGILPSQENARPSFWILRHDDSTLMGAQYALVDTPEHAGVPFEILDVDFFDDIEVVLLLRRELPGHLHKYTLATIFYTELELQDLTAGGINSLAGEATVEPIPFRRIHHFASSFEPLQFALNGREGRRVACILGNNGKVLEVLDMEEPAEDAEEEEEQVYDQVDED